MKILRGYDGFGCFFLRVEAEPFNAARTRMEPGHHAVDRQTYPMEVYADYPFRVGRTPFPLSSGHTPVMDV